MFGYLTFNVKYYILSQIFYKKNRVCVYYLVFATCLWHDLFIWNPSTSCSKNCSRSARRGIERELQDQSQNALLCYRAWYAFATELLSRTCVKTDGLLDGETFLNKFFCPSWLIVHFQILYAISEIWANLPVVSL